MSSRPLVLRRLGGLGLVVVALISTVGTLWAFQRGGGDFDVFHSAWRLVLAGRGSEIYYSTPDRYLYAPGFAWLLSPLGLLPRPLALAFWCLTKAASLFAIVRLCGRRLESELGVHWTVASWGAVILARPVLIDFQYGQVNVFLAAAATWALLTHFDLSEMPRRRFTAWFALAIAGFSKLFPLPLLAVPCLPRARRSELLGAITGLSLVVGLPFVSGHGVMLYQSWRGALAARGFPLESHNQSFAAFLQHLFSGEPIHVVGLGPGTVDFHWMRWDPLSIQFLSIAWTAILLASIVAWILLKRPGHAKLEWSAPLIALLCLPSHLVWKPYFVLGIPLASLAVGRAAARGGYFRWAALAAIFVVMNCTGPDVLGAMGAAWAEASAVMLFAYLALFWVAACRDREEKGKSLHEQK